APSVQTRITAYLTDNFCPSFRVARIVSAKRKTIGPSFRPCDDQRISEGKKATPSAATLLTLALLNSCCEQTKMMGAVTAPRTELMNWMANMFRPISAYTTPT